MHIRYISEPSQQQKGQSTKPESLMLDQHVIAQPDSSSFTIAALDWAKNFVGSSEHRDPETAAVRGLPPDVRMNGGVIGSSTAKRVIETYPTLTGSPLIYALNQHLRQKCRDLGILNGAMGESDELEHMRTRRAELLTGLIGHVHVTPKVVEVTAVGDVYIAIDGEVVAGQEKLIDIEKAKIVHLMQEVFRIKKQEAYERYNLPMTEAQYHFQNEPESGRFYFPAIDGTRTPEDGITYIHQKKQVEHVLIFTDGLRLKDPTKDCILGNLEAVNEEYGERTAIELRNDGIWDQLSIERVQL